MSWGSQHCVEVVGCQPLPPAPLATSLPESLCALASCDTPIFRQRVRNPAGSCVTLQDTEEELGRALLASVQPASHALQGNPFFLTLNIFTAMRKNMQSFDPVLLPICTTDTLRSPTPDGCFTRNCANAKCKESSCPQIRQEIALR